MRYQIQNLKYKVFDFYKFKIYFLSTLGTKNWTSNFREKVCRPTYTYP